MDADYIPTFRTEGYEHAFTGLGDAFVDDDLTIVNLECAASTVGAPVKRVFNFNCELEALPVLREAGVEVVNLANNHGADWGLEGLLDTKRNTTEAGLAPVGVGADLDEATTPALFDIGGWTIAVLGFNGVVPGESWVAGDDHPGAADGRDAELMAAAVAAADEQADLVLVTVHWGRELQLVPLDRDVESAKAMIDAGADAIFGHHPHRLQALEFHDGKPIAWSLGNFVWPRLSVAGATSAIAQVIVEPDGTVDACLIPVEIESHGHPVIQDVGPGPADDTTCRS
jgi:poly-gamma-glutamate synthesis protein (capsule biosynthesis protein)